jgi:hypothetical protein
VTGWWRRNRLPLVATLVLAPLTVGVVFQEEWGGFREGRAVEAVDVAGDADAVFGDASWRVTGADRIRWSSDPGAEQELPPGTDLVVVRMTVTPGVLDAGASVGCLLQLEEVDGGRSSRTWQPTSTGSVRVEAELAADSSGCDSTLTEPYEVAARFLVPVGAGDEGDLRLAIQTVGELPRYLRVAL